MLTLMAVHAHPDDEVLSTGGVLARSAAEGIRTVLVTCTNGEQGDGPGGVKPGEEGHDEAAVRALRLEELKTSAGILGIEHVELLGYHDSGMEGWDANHAAEAFWNVPVAESTAKLIALMEHYQPDVVVTYDDSGAYGHPDHIQANRITVAAVEASGIPKKFYYTAIPKSGITEMWAFLKESGIEAPGMDLDNPPDFGTPDELVTTIVEVIPYAKQKVKALEAHASQGENIFFLRMPEDVQQMMFGKESFVRIKGEGPLPEDDLFAGLR